MPPQRTSLKRTLLISSVFAISLFTAGGLAQNTRSNTNTNTNQSGQQSTTRNGGGNNTPSTSASTNDAKSTTTPQGPSTGVITGSASGPTASAPTNLPTITGSNTGDDPAKLTGLPTLSRTVDQSIPTYPPPAVPPTNQAPFMQQSKLPEGTVFIAVGAILGAFGLAIIIWRAVVACLLHRSVEQAALAQHQANDKASFPAPPAPFYKYTDRDSSPNLVAGRGTRRSNRGPTPSATPSQTNLFFSPTAGPGAGGLNNGNNRDSRFLPSGFYAATSPSPLGVRHEHSISLSNLRPDSRGRAMPAGHSPPDSPSYGPTRTTPVPRNVSTSSVSLNRPVSQGSRAPSAFLNDLLDEQPHMFPPGGSGQHQRNFSGSTHGRH